jgi:hypothetical protein
VSGIITWVGMQVLRLAVSSNGQFVAAYTQTRALLSPSNLHGLGRDQPGRLSGKPLERNIVWHHHLHCMQVLRLAVSSNGQFVAAYTSDGVVHVSNADFSRQLSEFDTKVGPGWSSVAVVCCAVVVLCCGCAARGARFERRLLAATERI